MWSCPEHVHLLVSEPERRNLWVVLKPLKQAVARRVLSALRPRSNSQQSELFPRFSVPRSFWKPVSMISICGVRKNGWRRRVAHFFVSSRSKRKSRVPHFSPLLREVGWSCSTNVSPQYRPILDPHRTSFLVSIEPKAAPAPLIGRIHQTACYRIAMNIAQLFNPLTLAPHIEVVEAVLPKPNVAGIFE